jgi:hypothetical protein
MMVARRFRSWKKKKKNGQHQKKKGVKEVQLKSSFFSGGFSIVATAF